MVEWFIKTSRRIWLDSIAKLAVRLIHPILHAHHSPEYTARAVGVGLFVAFTPFFGAHIAIVLAIWLIAKSINRGLSFNPVIASAWTLLSNAFTIVPLFYVFIQTGFFILGRWESMQSFESYRPEFEQTSYANTGWIEIMSLRVLDLLTEFGIPLFIGSLPWALCISIAGYFLSLHFIRRHHISQAQ